MVFEYRYPSFILYNEKSGASHLKLLEPVVLQGKGSKGLFPITASDFCVQVTCLKVKLFFMLSFCCVELVHTWAFVFWLLFSLV